MNILFLCANIEPGKDGVGDYTRKLAGALIRQGCNINIIALNDRYIDTENTDHQQDEGTTIKIYRFSSQQKWKEKIDKLNTLIDHFKPEWISLQYVPYGFNKKGMPFFLPAVLQKIKGDFKWHIMFHEMWIGISSLSPTMHKVYGFFQKNIAASIVDKLKPALITTTNRLYQLVMKEKNIIAELLPLFSNISVYDQDKGFLKNIEEKHGIHFGENDTFFLGVFGTLYPSAGLAIHIPAFIKTVNTKNIVIIFFGRNTHPNELAKIKALLKNTVQVIQLNELSTQQVSSIFSVIDKAILCTPKEHTGKSGAYAALRLHYVDVMVPSSQPIPVYEKEIAAYNILLQERPAAEWGVNFISEQFLNLLRCD